ncbi:MAG: condensation domain-containing protein [Lentisphaeraceae bacterium]|nr:condensation domain-containing protein [Lentisphaeraceae bacterium]
MKKLFKPLPFLVCLVIAGLWLSWLKYIAENSPSHPASLGQSLSPWFKPGNLLSALFVFIIAYSLSFIRIAARQKVSKSRPMGTSEHLWYRMGELDSNNFVMLARLEGEIDETELKGALEKVIHSQPMLRCVAKKSGSKFRLLQCTSAPAKISILPRGNDDSWQQKAEEEMNCEIAVDADALWRFSWLKGEGKHELLLTLNHMIADGRSGLQFYEMLFKVLADKQYVSPELELFPAYEDQLISTDNVLSSTFKFFRAGSEYLKSKNLKWNKIAPSARDQSNSVLISETLQKESTEMLLQKCRKNKTTVTSLLSALLLDLIEGDNNTALSVAADMRPYLSNLKGSEMGYFVTSIDLIKGQSFEGGIWDLARTAKVRIQRQLNKSQFLFDQLIRYLALKTAKTDDDFRDLIKKSLNNSILITNIGKVNMQTDYGSFVLKQCCHIPAVHLMNLPFLCLAVSTVNGEMVLNFTYNAGFIHNNEAQRLVKKFMKRLQSL